MSITEFNYPVLVQQQQVERDVLLKEREELKEAFAEHEHLEKQKVQRTQQVCRSRLPFVLSSIIKQ